MCLVSVLYFNIALLLRYASNLNPCIDMQMKMTLSELIQLLKTIEELGYKHFRLHHDGLTLEVGRVEIDSEETGFEVKPSTASQPTPSTAVQTAVSPSASAQDTFRARTDRSGLVAIKAPMAGTYYAASGPGEPPFVEVGSRVSDRDIIGIIEVMKLFNSIPAGVSGTVEEVCVVNEQVVSAGDSILWIRP